MKKNFLAVFFLISSLKAISQPINLVDLIKLNRYDFNTSYQYLKQSRWIYDSTFYSLGYEIDAYHFNPYNSNYPYKPKPILGLHKPINRDFKEYADYKWVFIEFMEHSTFVSIKKQLAQFNAKLITSITMHNKESMFYKTKSFGVKLEKLTALNTNIGLYTTRYFITVCSLPYLDLSIKRKQEEYDRPY